MSDCLVVGGAGFLGSAVARALSRKGHGVAVFDLFPREPLIPLPRSIERIRGDLRSPSEVRRAVQGREAVFHFACASTPATSLLHPERERNWNILPSLGLIESCVRAGVRKFVFCSSGSVYGPWRGRPFKETDPTRPLTPYGVSKMAVERALFEHQAPGLEITILRPGSAYGPGQDPLSGQGAPTAFLHGCSLGRPLTLYGRGTVERDFVFVRDVVRCAVRSLAPGGPQVLNVSTGLGTSILRLAGLCRGLARKAVPLIHRRRRLSDAQTIVLDNTLARKLLGLRPTPLAEGLHLTLAWLRSDFALPGRAVSPNPPAGG